MVEILFSQEKVPQNVSKNKLDHRASMGVALFKLLAPACVELSRERESFTHSNKILKL